jgi:ABC-type polysaccharide/polyol phosphate export permease
VADEKSRLGPNLRIREESRVAPIAQSVAYRSDRPVEDINEMTISSVSDVPYSGLRSLKSTAWEDLTSGLSKTGLWGRMGWLDVKRKYRRTMLGPFWTSITLGVYVLSVGLLGAGLWHQNIREYLPFLVSGMVVWMLVSTIISDSCLVLITGQILFRNVRFEFSIFAYALVWRNFIIFLHNLIVYVLVAVPLKPELLGWPVLLAIPGTLLVLVNGVWLAVLVGMLCLRFRDVPPLVTTALQISMLITPLFWPPDSLSGSGRIIFVGLNPIYHLIEVVRAPLLGSVPAMTSYAAVVLTATGGWLLTYYAFRRFRSRIAYWS